MDGVWDARLNSSKASRPLAVARDPVEGLAVFLVGVERCLESALRDSTLTPSVLVEAGRHLALAPGAKRARPMMAYLLGEAAGVRQGLAEVAGAVELIHTASLLHDDVIDEASQRRGRAAVNAQWNNMVAVLAGDWVLTAALRLLQHGHPGLVHAAIDVVAEMSVAAAAEVAARRSVEMGTDGWLRMAEGKTGALFGLIGFAVGMSAQSLPLAERLSVACRHLGIAFQLADDIADLMDHASETPFQDVRDGNPSYPVLWAASADAELRELLLNAWSQPQPMAQELARALAARVLQTDAVRASFARAWVAINDAATAFGPELNHPCIQRLMGWAETLTQIHTDPTKRI